MDLGICFIKNSENGKREVVYSGAKHKLYMMKGGEIDEVKSDRYSIGGASADEDKDFTNQTVELAEGDIIYLTTDGYPDQANKHRRSFNPRRFKELLVSIHQESMDKQLERLTSALEEHQGRTEQRDDITVIGVKL